MISFANYKYIIYISLTAFILILLYLAYIFWKKRILSGIFTGASLKDLLLQRNPVIIRLKTVLIILSILLTGIVILRPQWGETIKETKKEGVDLLVALDVSMSMLARDVEPSRLKRAKEAIKLMAESLKGDRIGLILFAGDSFLQCPLTTDIGAFFMFLDAAGPDSVKVQGTDIGKAVTAAERVFSKKRMTSRILVFITDGEDHEGTLAQAIEKFKEMEVTVYTLGIGKSEGELIPLEEDNTSGDIYYKDDDGKLIRTRKKTDVLKMIASETGGGYFDITQNLSGVYNVLDALSNLTKNEYGSQITKEKEERYQIFALILLIFLTAEALLPERRRKSL